MKKVIFLGPERGTTFTSEAYDVLAQIYDAPPAVTANYLPARTNADVLRMVIEHSGYGVLAMETLAGGRVEESLGSFIALLQQYEANEQCPIHIIGAVERTLHFCLMARRDVPVEAITGVVTHEKSIGACEKGLASLRLPVTTVSSNGEAARLVAEENAYASYAALGPQCAAQKYKLHVLADTCEDSEAVTTFFLVGPKRHHAWMDYEKNRVLIAFETAHTSGALCAALQPFADEGINLIQIHSVHVGNGTYHFGIEVAVTEEQNMALLCAMHAFQARVKKSLGWGPFPVTSR